jgi:outer membrane immunogenic protein
MMPPVYSWNGFYLGVNGGAAWGDGGTRTVDWTSANFDPGPDFSDSRTAKGLFGFHGGYNLQVTRSWVLGVEGDFDWTSLSHTNASTLNFLGVPFGISNTTVSDKIDWLSSARARIGYTWGSVMPYATGGIAFSKREFSGVVQANSTAAGALEAYSNDQITTGWVAGAGLEYMPIPNVVIRAEYLHYGFNNGETFTIPSSTLITASCGKSCPASVTYANSNVDVARVGVSYLFGPK